MRARGISLLRKAAADERGPEIHEGHEGKKKPQMNANKRRQADHKDTKAERGHLGLGVGVSGLGTGVRGRGTLLTGWTALGWHGGCAAMRKGGPAARGTAVQKGWRATVEGGRTGRKRPSWASCVCELPPGARHNPPSPKRFVSFVLFVVEELVKSHPKGAEPQRERRFSISDFSRTIAASGFHLRRRPYL